MASTTAEPVQVGPYRIDRKIGAGQIGDVYAATGPDGTRVAIKVLRVQAGNLSELRRRFRREAELCKAMRHPHVIAIADYGVHEDAPFLTMPLLHGRDLGSWLDELGALAPEVAVAIALQVCAGLAEAHARGIVHRDLKPANVFLDEAADGSMSVVVCDFGMAKIYDPDGALTASGDVLGTPLYMAPEQLLDSKHVDARSDVWAVGMVLYQALAGRAAFADVRGIADLVVVLGQNAVPPIQSFAQWIPAALARVVHAALLPREDRLTSVDELVGALRAWGPAPADLKREALVQLADDRRAHVATRAALPKKATELGTPDADTVTTGRSPMAASEPPPDAFVGSLVAARYRIGERLGSGGMGSVYEALDENATGEQPREVAVKLMTSDRSGTEGTRRFLREARAASRIDSPYVTKVLAFGVDETSGAPFLVMERLRGSDLATTIARHGALEPEPVIALFLQAAEGVRAAHALGLVHRDIKPSNLFVHEGADGSATMKVCDFGIAKQLSRDDLADTSTEITRTGGILGSPLYMSPEQARSAKNVDERSDVFSLSLTLHEALSGERPWRGRTSMGEIILAVCTEDVPPLAKLAPWIASELGDVIARGLARDPARRMQSASELRNALAPFAATGPVSMKAIVGVSKSRRDDGVLPALAASNAGTSESGPTRRRSALAAVVIAVATAGIAIGLRSAATASPHDAPAAASRSDTAVAPAIVPSATPSEAPAPPPSSSVAAVAAVVTSAVPASPSTGPPAPRPAFHPAHAAAHATTTPATTAPSASPMPVTTASTAPRSDGRARSRKDDE